MRTCSLCLILCAGLAVAASTPTAPALTYSTYLRDNFRPVAMTTDASGNLYLAGNSTVDPAASQTTVLVIKLNPQANQILYLRYLGGAVSDDASAIAVDAAGNTYIAGGTQSPDFPVTTGGHLGTPPTSGLPRSFVTKLDPSGNVVFSDLLGGSAASGADAVAVTPAGQVIVSGTIQSAGFPTTPGTYSVSNSVNHPYLLELDATGTKVMFSAAGIGGNAIALDSAGNIYVAGSTTLPDYPTTPGVYQTAFPVSQSCTVSCQTPPQGFNQYVTKVDATGSKLIYSTSLSGASYTLNGGLAVDKAGNAYVTGVAGPSYPYTVTPSSIPALPGPGGPANPSALPFLSKLDAAGQALLFSVPVGGARVQVDSTGAVYVGGRIGYRLGSSSSGDITVSLPALAGVPAQCSPNGLTIQYSAYVSQADATTGNVLGTQFISGSNLNPSAVALSGTTLWIAGWTGGPDVPFTQNVLGDLDAPGGGFNLGVGAYLGAVDFSQPQPPSGTPQIGCLLDAGDFSPVGPATTWQVLAVFGTGLGPALGVTASDNATTSLAGVSVTFQGAAASLLYVSSTQINFAVPLVVQHYPQPYAAMLVTVNGLSAPVRLFPLVGANPHLFINAAATYQDAAGNPDESFVPFALNADGSVNSSSNPAQQGSTVSVFVNGLGVSPDYFDVNLPPLQLNTTAGWTVAKVAPITPFVFRVDVQPPPLSVGSLPPCQNCGCSPTLCWVSLELSTETGILFSPHTGGRLYVRP